MNRERVQMLRDMIAGIPAKRINLERVFKDDKTGTERETPSACGAIACMAGWAWLYPPFVEQGIRQCGEEFPVQNALIFFDVGYGTFKERDGERGSHKQIALRRLDALLK